MNHKLKRKWVAALRGGTYKQIKYNLGNQRDDNKRCAIGVLLEAAGPIEPDEYGYGPDIDPNYAYHLLRKETGLEPEVIHGMNDGEMSFNQIADWIEEYL